MPAFSALFATLLASFRKRAALQVEILALRHQLGVLQRSVKRPKLSTTDRTLLVCLSSVWSEWRTSVIIVKAATVIAWHRKGFRLFWTWKVRHGKAGRPMVPREVRELIRIMSRENPIWGAPRIHGELLKLGIDIGETSVSKYMVRRRRPPSQTWKTFLANHVKSMVSIDFFTVPTIRFQVLYVLLVLAHAAYVFAWLTQLPVPFRVRRLMTQGPLANGCSAWISPLWIANRSVMPLI